MKGMLWEDNVRYKDLEKANLIRTDNVHDY